MNTTNYDKHVNETIVNKLISLGFDWQHYYVCGFYSGKWHWEIPHRIAQRWLYDIKGYSVIVNHTIGNDPKTIYSEYEVIIAKMDKEYGSFGNIIYTIHGCYVTYDQALEDGLDKCLNIIIEEEKQ